MNKDKQHKTLEHKYLLGIEDKTEFEKIKSDFDQLNDNTDDPIDLSASYNRIQKRLNKSIKPKSNVILKFKKQMAIAASILLALGITYYFYYDKNETLTAAHIAQIKPSNSKIIINGKEVELNNDSVGLLVSKVISPQRSNIDFQEDNDTTTTTIIVPKGKQLQFTLADGSQVWLNANSQIKFPNSFTGKRRFVELQGEGYFEVKHLNESNFLVKTDKQTIEVLGTKFNIKAYEDDKNTVTTLAEGSVKISGNNKTLYLKPNQQTTLQEDGSIRTTKVDAEDYTAWIDGYFVFNNASTLDIMTQISKWYDLDIIHAEGDSRERFTGKISNKANLADIEKILKNVGIKLSITQNRKTKNYNITNVVE